MRKVLQILALAISVLLTLGFGTCSLLGTPFVLSSIADMAVANFIFTFGWWLAGVLLTAGCFYLARELYQRIQKP